MNSGNEKKRGGGKYYCGVISVAQIIKEHLKKHGFEGLWCPHEECGCFIADLAPCDNNPLDCEPGYRKKNQFGEDIIGPDAGVKRRKADKMKKQKLEPRSQWTEDILAQVARDTDNPKVKSRVLMVLQVLRHGAKKHGGGRRRGAKMDIFHAMGHINRHGDPIELESGLPHEMHAAADCLLAFGDLVGLSEQGGNDAKD